jgi:predicted TIM-barrel fold metal-dependent hydrolase
MKPARPHPTFLAVDPAWLALHEEDILQPELPIVDAHHHLWDRAGWRYLMDELLSDLGSGHRIVGTVFVECFAMYRATGPEWLRPVGETEFANGIAAMSASGAYGSTRIAQAIVGHADLRHPQLDELLQAHVRAAGGRLRGVRQIVAWDDDLRLNNPEAGSSPQLLRDPAFRRGMAQLEKAGLSFDAWLYHPQIDELTALARAVPGCRIVLDHIGGPLGADAYEGRGDEVFARWARSIKELARCPNVFVKIGGMGMRVFGFALNQRARPPSSQALADLWRPCVETCIEAFGARRCMFESNFPVDKGAYAYAIGWNAMKRLAQGASAQEREALFSGTAQRFYRLGDCDS